MENDYDYDDKTLCNWNGVCIHWAWGECMLTGSKENRRCSFYMSAMECELVDSIPHDTTKLRSANKKSNKRRP